MDGTERLGVLGFTVADVSAAMLDRYRTLASLAAVVARADHAIAGQFGDSRFVTALLDRS